MTERKEQPVQPKRRRAPARTPEARENQLINLATDLAERQLAEGTASAQVITHYLKLATQREMLEREKLESENELLKAKTSQIVSGERAEQLMKEALAAFTEYTPSDEDEYGV